MNLFDDNLPPGAAEPAFPSHEVTPLFDECALRAHRIPPAAAYGAIVCALLRIYEADSPPPKDAAKAALASDTRHDRARAAVADVTTALAQAGYHIAPNRLSPLGGL